MSGPSSGGITHAAVSLVFVTILRDHIDGHVAMNEKLPPLQSSPASAIDQLFPKLTAAQMTRIAAHGRRRPVQHGEVLFEAGASPYRSSW